MRIGIASPSDAEAIAALERECFGADAWSAAAVAGELERVPESRHVVVARGEDADGGTIRAYADLMVAGELGDVQRVAVAPPWRGRGLGRRLLGALMAEATRRGCVRVLLEVGEHNAAARRSYEATGFTVISVRPGYYGAGVDALVMARELSASDGAADA